MARIHSFSNGRVVIAFLVVLAVSLLATQHAGAHVATNENDRGVYRVDDGTVNGAAYRDDDGTATGPAGRVHDGTRYTGIARDTDGAPATSTNGRESDGVGSGLVISRPMVDPTAAMVETPAEVAPPSLLERYWGFLVVLVMLFWALNETVQHSEGPSKAAYRFRSLVRRLVA